MRSTNVYEEQSLGIYHEDEEEPEDTSLLEGSRVSVWGRYLARHARMQLAFGGYDSLIGRPTLAVADTVTPFCRYVVASHRRVPCLHHRGKSVLRIVLCEDRP